MISSIGYNHRRGLQAHQPAETEAEVAAAAVAEVTDEAAAPAAVTTEDPELKASSCSMETSVAGVRLSTEALSTEQLIQSLMQPFSLSA